MGLWGCPTVILQYHSPAVYTMGLWGCPTVILQYHSPAVLNHCSVYNG